MPFILILLLFSLALQPSVGYGLLVSRGFFLTHNDAPQSVGLLWSSDQLVADNTQHTQQTSAPPVEFEPMIAVDLRLRPRGHWDRRIYNHYCYDVCIQCYYVKFTCPVLVIHHMSP
jgi:hypothetical protein